MGFQKKRFSYRIRHKSCSECGERFSDGQTIYLRTKTTHHSTRQVIRVKGALCKECHDKKFV